MNRFFFITSVLFLSVISVVSFGSSSVSATSVFDTTYKSVDSMILNDGGHCSPTLDPKDITTDWSQFITNSDNWNDPNNTNLQAMKSSFLTSLDSGRWGVSINESQTVVYVFWTEDTSLALNWSADSNTRTIGAYSTTDSGVHTVSISQLCSFGLNKFGIMPFNYYELHNSDGFYEVSKEDLFGTRIINNFLIYTDFPNYPNGYEGDIIRETYDPPVVNDSTPDFFVVSSVNGLVTIRDRSFNTFDNVPFSCADGLTPYIRYTLQDLDHYLIFDTGGFSPTVDYQFQLPVKNQIINYEFSGRYDCGENTDPSFPNSSSVQFQLDPLGGLKTDLFEECISQEFPFIHYEGCYENVMRMLNMLSFSTLKINGWTYNAQCRQLTVLGGWLGTQPGQVICPNFSAQVRNTVTPFIAFFLGLTMFGFLIHRKGGL